MSSSGGGIYVVFPFRVSFIVRDLLVFLVKQIQQVTISLASQSVIIFWIWNWGNPRSGQEAKAMLGFMCLQTWTLSSPAALALATSTLWTWGSIKEEINFIRIVKTQEAASGEKARLSFSLFTLCLLCKKEQIEENVKIWMSYFGVPYLALVHRCFNYFHYPAIFSKICFCVPSQKEAL